MFMLIKEKNNLHNNYNNVILDSNRVFCAFPYFPLRHLNPSLAYFWRRKKYGGFPISSLCEWLQPYEAFPKPSELFQPNLKLALEIGKKHLFVTSNYTKSFKSL